MHSVWRAVVAKRKSCCCSPGLGLQEMSNGGVLEQQSRRQSRVLQTQDMDIQGCWAGSAWNTLLSRKELN